jgi:hypothetical protein
MLLAGIIIAVVILGVVIIYHTRGVAMAMAVIGYSYTHYPHYFDKYQYQMINETIGAQIMPMMETLLEPLYDVNLIQKGHQLLDKYNRNDKTMHVDDLYASLIEVKEQLESRYNSLILINKSQSVDAKYKYNDRANNLYYRKEYLADYAQYHVNETSHLIDSIQKVFV